MTARRVVRSAQRLAVGLARAAVPTAVALLVASPAIATAFAQSPASVATLVSSPDTTMDAALVHEIEAAAARGIPTAPLLAKVREGRLKRASAPRIRSAVSALIMRLDSARAALGSGASADELVAGADALAAGADAGAVRAVHAATLGRPASAPLGALAQLVASGVPSPRAVSMVVELLRRNASPAQVLAYGNLVESDVVSGLPAEEAALLRLHSFAASSGFTSVAGEGFPGSNTTGSLVTPPPPTPPPSSKTPKRRP